MRLIIATKNTCDHHPTGSPYFLYTEGYPGRSLIFYIGGAETSGQWSMDHAKEVNLDIISKECRRRQSSPTFRIMSMIVSDNYATYGGMLHMSSYICWETLHWELKAGMFFDRVSTNLRSLDDNQIFYMWVTSSVSEGMQRVDRPFMRDHPASILPLRPVIDELLKTSNIISLSHGGITSCSKFDADPSNGVSLAAILESALPHPLL